MGALDAFTDGVEWRVDLARVNDRVFVNNASLGVYAKVVQSDAYRDAKLGTRERIDTGWLGVLAVLVRSAADVSKLVAFEPAGQTGRFPGLESWSTRELEVRSAGPVEVGLDGEALVLDPPSALRVAARGATGGGRPVSHPAARLVLGLVVFVLVGWGVGELWTSVGGSVELNAVRDVAAQHTAALTDVARVLTWAGSAFLLVPLALIVCLAFARAGLRREAIAVALSLSGAMLISDWVKLLVSRPRPPVEHLQAVIGSSFPSGHATQASAFWFSLVFVLPAAGTSPKLTRVAGGLALLIVLAVATSRVYLSVHYPSDVVAGLLLGTGWAVYVSRCMVDESTAVPQKRRAP